MGLLDLLKKLSGRPQSDNDVKWALLNKQSLNAARVGDWGLYRNTKFAQAEILRKEARWEEALSAYLGVCYLDLNGPQNTGGSHDRQHPPFDPAGAIMADGVLGRVAGMIEKLDFDAKQTHAVFRQIADVNHHSLGLPIAPETAWNKLKARLFT